eukprot:4766182-Prymnesium_polylepis.2
MSAASRGARTCSVISSVCETRPPGTGATCPGPTRMPPTTVVRLNDLDDLDESRLIPQAFGDAVSLSSALGVLFPCCRLAASNAFCSAFALLAMVIASRIVRKWPIALLNTSLSSEATSSSFLFSRCEACGREGL